MNKLDLEETRKKLNAEYEKHMKEYSFQSEIDKIARDIRERQDNAMAMEFTQKIGQMLRKNGVVPHITEYKTEMECIENSVKQRYGVEFDRLDFTEHDKPFKDEIRQLRHDLKEMQMRAAGFESEIAVRDNLLKIKNGLCEDKPRIHIIGLREFGGEQYMRYSDVEELIRELED